MTAKTIDGKEIFSDEKIYMPQSPAYGRGSEMVYGSYKKAGLLRDTSLQPGQTRIEIFEIRLPETGARNGNPSAPQEIYTTVRLWYIPRGVDPKNGVPGKDQFLFFEETKTIKVE
ncbi:MAG: hypothetical protein ACUVUQ_01465 [Thermodesulfovibrionales bacterium]